jgi:SH3-like domain-containing protein
MNDDRDVDDTGAGMLIVRRILPWVALAGILWVLAGFMAQFRTAADSIAASSTASASVSATASVVTTVTGMSATLRSDMTLISEPATGSAKVVAARGGSIMEVVAKSGTWLRLKDASGRLGWVPNNSKYLVVKTQ